jgi:hypothetical protein
MLHAILIHIPLSCEWISASDLIDVSNYYLQLLIQKNYINTASKILAFFITARLSHLSLSLSLSCSLDLSRPK